MITPSITMSDVSLHLATDIKNDTDIKALFEEYVGEYGVYSMLDYMGFGEFLPSYIHCLCMSCDYGVKTTFYPVIEVVVKRAIVNNTYDIQDSDGIKYDNSVVFIDKLTKLILEKTENSIKDGIISSNTIEKGYKLISASPRRPLAETSTDIWCSLELIIEKTNCKG